MVDHVLKEIRDLKMVIRNSKVFLYYFLICILNLKLMFKYRSIKQNFVSHCFNFNGHPVWNSAQVISLI